MGSLMEKYLYLLYEGGVCFFGDEKKNSPLVFYELLCLSTCLFIVFYLCIYWILFMSFGIFVDVFSGVVVRLVSTETGVHRMKTR